MSTKYHAQESKIRTRRGTTEVSPFDDLASVYDAWFDEEGKLIFAIEVPAFHEVLPSLPKPWLEVGVGSGRFAQALGIETGVDPSIKLLEMARERGITGFLGRGEQELFEEKSFGTVFMIVTLCFLDSPLDVLTEAYRILVPSGKIVLGLVLNESPWVNFMKRERSRGTISINTLPFTDTMRLQNCWSKPAFRLSRLFQRFFKGQAR